MCAAFTTLHAKSCLHGEIINYVLLNDVRISRAQLSGQYIVAGVSKTGLLLRRVQLLHAAHMPWQQTGHDLAKLQAQLLCCQGLASSLECLPAVVCPRLLYHKKSLLHSSSSRASCMAGLEAKRVRHSRHMSTASHACMTAAPCTPACCK